MKINFHEPHVNKAVHLHPFLQLWEEGLPPKTQRPVVNETYNEIVFVEPSPQMMQLLTQGPDDEASLAHDASESEVKDEKLKPIDRQSLIKGYKDKEFQVSEQKSLELLDRATEFLAMEIAKKTQNLAELENKIKQERVNVKTKKEHLFQVRY